jgi:hypothetical protein
MDRHVSLFWRAYHLHPREADMEQTLATLKSEPEFLKRWEELEQGKDHLVLVEHDSLHLRHPSLGPLEFMIWRTTLAADERFIVAHFPAADEATHRAISNLLGK